jgi:hypothetical protein
VHKKRRLESSDFCALFKLLRGQKLFMKIFFVNFEYVRAYAKAVKKPLSEKS